MFRVHSKPKFEPHYTIGCIRSKHWLILTPNQTIFEFLSNKPCTIKFYDTLVNLQHSITWILFSLRQAGRCRLNDNEQPFLEFEYIKRQQYRTKICLRTKQISCVLKTLAAYYFFVVILIYTVLLSACCAQPSQFDTLCREKAKALFAVLFAVLAQLDAHFAELYVGTFRETEHRSWIALMQHQLNWFYS